MLCTKVFDDPAVRRAKMSIAKRMNHEPRKAMFIRRRVSQSRVLRHAPHLASPRHVVEKIMRHCALNIEMQRHAFLYLLAYAFLLRLPSEALPVTAGKSSGPNALYREGGELVLELARRKNKPAGSRLVRSCWCRECEASR